MVKTDSLTNRKDRLVVSNTDIQKAIELEMELQIDINMKKR